MSWPRPLHVVSFNERREWRAYTISKDDEILEASLDKSGRWGSFRKLGYQAPADAVLQVDAWNDGSIVPGTGNVHIRITWADEHGNLTNIAYDDGHSWKEHKSN